MDDAETVLDRALRYPYESPAASFVLAGGRALDPGAVDPGPARREPLLAYGANASPEALARKLGRDAAPLPAERATLRDHDVVYSAHLSLYGAVPATLAPSKGTEVGVFVLQATEQQRIALAASEPNYELVELDLGAAGGRLTAYLSRHGPLESDGAPLALAEVVARGRRLPALDQRGALELVRERVAPEAGLERFVLETAADPALARRRTELLRSWRSGAGRGGR